MNLCLSNNRSPGWCQLAHQQAKQPHNDNQHRCLASGTADAADTGNMPWAAAAAAAAAKGTNDIKWLKSDETVLPEVWHRCMECTIAM